MNIKRLLIVLFMSLSFPLLAYGIQTGTFPSAESTEKLILPRAQVPAYQKLRNSLTGKIGQLNALVVPANGSKVLTREELLRLDQLVKDMRKDLDQLHAMVQLAQNKYGLSICHQLQTTLAEFSNDIGKKSNNVKTLVVDQSLVNGAHQLKTRNDVFGLLEPVITR